MKPTQPSRPPLSGLSRISPMLAALIAEKMWFTAPRPPADVLSADEGLLSSAEPVTVSVGGQPRPGYALGDGPLVFLAHGWGGWAAQLGSLAIGLASSGFRVVAIDLPGHGSDPRRRSDIGQMAAGLDSMADRFGSPVALVAHSLGALATVVSFSNSPPPAAVFIAPVLVTDLVVDSFAITTGLTPPAAARFRRRLYGRFASLAPYLNGGPAADLPGTELLLVHDRSDRRAPFAVSEWFATRRPGTRLLEVSALGHQRLLRERPVIDEVVGFVRERTGELRRAG